MTLGLFLMFSGTLLFVVYSLEDAVYKEQLKEAASQLARGGRLADSFRIVNDLSEFELASRFPSPSEELNPTEVFGEFSNEERHYHYMRLDGAYLLLDSTNVPIVQRALDDIMLVLIVMLVPALLLALWVAWATSRHALKPFERLGEVFAEHQSVTAVDHAEIERIEEEDVKQIARELFNALDTKARAVEQQAAFSQGMAHELRTPLQVMTHSLELLAQTQPQLSGSAPFARLEKSITRMQRISDGLLWLTSTQVFTGSINVDEIVKDTLASLESEVLTHHVDVSIDVRQPCQLPLPEEVMALIVFNLLNNLVHHGKSSGGQLPWRIVIDKRCISFSNPSERAAQVPLQAQGFGIGLLLVEKLARRFSIGFECKAQDGWFSASLKLE